MGGAMRSGSAACVMHSWLVHASTSTGTSRSTSTRRTDGWLLYLAPAQGAGESGRGPARHPRLPEQVESRRTDGGGQGADGGLRVLARPTGQHLRRGCVDRRPLLLHGGADRWVGGARP